MSKALEDYLKWMLYECVTLLKSPYCLYNCQCRIPTSHEIFSRGFQKNKIQSELTLTTNSIRVLTPAHRQVRSLVHSKESSQHRTKERTARKHSPIQVAVSSITPHRGRNGVAEINASWTRSCAVVRIQLKVDSSGEKKYNIYECMCTQEIKIKQNLLQKRFLDIYNQNM